LGFGVWGLVFWGLAQSPIILIQSKSLFDKNFD